MQLAGAGACLVFVLANMLHLRSHAGENDTHAATDEAFICTKRCAFLVDSKCKMSCMSVEMDGADCRDSKLTRILEDSIGGNCKTTMMAMISPALEAYAGTAPHMLC